MTQAKLRELLINWQQKLRLVDWKIKLKFCDLENIYGNCLPEIEAKTATIKILNLNDRLWLEDKEITPELVLVHEILHVHFWPIHDCDINHPQMIRVEQAINIISEALINN